MSPSQTERLKDLAKTCTAAVLRDKKPIGTAFFIDDRLALTCAHVLRKVGKYEIQPFGTTLQLEVTPAGEPDVVHDIALLRVEWSTNEPSPAVVIDTEARGESFFVLGYLTDALVGHGLETFDITTHQNQAITGELQKLVIEAGRRIFSGMSGGPVVNLDSGAVVAITRSSENLTRSEGGGAIPVQHAIESFAEVRRVYEEPSTAVRRWRDTVGPERWRALGKPWNLDASIDLKVTGTPTQWHVDVGQSEGSGADRSGKDLGADIAEALFRWAQRRRPRNEEDVRLLGGLLSEALFPPEVETALRRLNGADKITVRLMIERGNPLGDIPWELAAVPSHSGRFLAVDKEFRFVRVLHDRTNASGDVIGRDESIPVLAVVVQPSWNYPVTMRKWPTTSAMSSRIQLNHLPRLAVECLENPLRSTVESRLRDGEEHAQTPAVLHYIGVGRLYNNVPQLVLFADTDEHSWEPIVNVLRWAADSGVRAVILQFTEMPVDKDWEPIPSSAITRVLPPGIEALVATSIPVHPNQLGMFNDILYKQLALGRSVDDAVQESRRELKGNSPVQDPSGFAFFTLHTGAGPEVCLIEPPLDKPNQHGPAAAGHPATGDRPIATAGRRPGVTDDFVG